jgi:two-component system, LytTR family, response regulator
VKVTVLIADDEQIARAGLREMLAPFDWVVCVGEAASGPATIAAIDILHPELVFLDIQMPGVIGTELLGHVTHQPFIVFTTAYAQYAATAFELGALDYLLKPFGPQRLATTLERVRAVLGDPNTPPAMDRLREALATGPMSRLFVRSGRTIIPIAVSEVTWLEALGDYVIAHTSKSRHTLHVTLNRLEARLDSKRFARIHRTHIVNLDHVAAFRQMEKGRLVAELSDGTRVPVSRSRSRHFRSVTL